MQSSKVVGYELIKKKLTVSVAESCTGGLITNLLTDVSGSSNYLKGSCIAYSNHVKQEMLGVSAELLKKHGAVSPQVVSVMARNVRVVFNTHIGLSVSGIAGPTGGTKEKPVGLIFIAIDHKGGTEVKKFNFTGTRKQIKLQAAYTALDLIRKTIADI